MGKLTRLWIDPRVNSAMHLFGKLYEARNNATIDANNMQFAGLPKGTVMVGNKKHTAHVISLYDKKTSELTIIRPVFMQMIHDAIKKNYKNIFKDTDFIHGWEKKINKYIADYRTVNTFNYLVALASDKTNTLIRIEDRKYSHKILFAIVVGLNVGPRHTNEIETLYENMTLYRDHPIMRGVSDKYVPGKK